MVVLSAVDLSDPARDEDTDEIDLSSSSFREALPGGGTRRSMFPFATLEEAENDLARGDVGVVNAADVLAAGTCIEYRRDGCGSLRSKADLRTELLRGTIVSGGLLFANVELEALDLSTAPCPPRLLRHALLSLLLIAIGAAPRILLPISDWLVAIRSVLLPLMRETLPVSEVTEP